MRGSIQVITLDLDENQGEKILIPPSQIYTLRKRLYLNTKEFLF